ncbi:MAG: hypothetical protein ACTSUK_09415 [Promethearchaeota archaeon]
MKTGKIIILVSLLVMLIATIFPFLVIKVYGTPQGDISLNYAGYSFIFGSFGLIMFVVYMVQGADALNQAYATAGLTFSITTMTMVTTSMPIVMLIGIILLLFASFRNPVAALIGGIFILISSLLMIIFFDSFIYASLIAYGLSTSGSSYSVGYGYGLFVIAGAGLLSIIGAIIAIKEKKEE